MTYVDSARHDTISRYGFLIESDTGLATRIAATPVRANNVYDPVIEASYMTLVAVFQYLIGNNDWSRALRFPAAAGPGQDRARAVVSGLLSTR